MGDKKPGRSPKKKGEKKKKVKSSVTPIFETETSSVKKPGNKSRK